MKVRYYREPKLQEDHVDIHFREETEKIGIIRNFFSSFEGLMGKKDDVLHRLHPDSIYYLEVVDRKLFAYQEKEVYQLEYSMRGFLESYEKNGFVQIGKSMVVNLYKVSRVKADLNMRLRLHMDNGEILILNRTYKKSFLDALARIRKI